MVSGWQLYETRVPSGGCGNLWRQQCSGVWLAGRQHADSQAALLVRYWGIY